MIELDAPDDPGDLDDPVDPGSEDSTNEVASSRKNETRSVLSIFI